jgi:SnoaL-like domain
VPLIDAIASGDRDAVADLLADDVVFHSPVQTYRGRDQVAHLLAAIGTVMEDVESLRKLEGVTFFAGRIGEHPVDGVLDVRGHAPDIAEITLYLRPLAALQAGVARLTRALAKP